MRKSITTVSLSGMLAEKLEAAAARFDGVEIFENDLLNFPGAPADVRRLCAELGLRVEMFQPFRDFEGVGPEQLQRNLDAVQDVVAAVRQAVVRGATMLAISPNYYDDLAAKYGTPQETLDLWRSLGIMMDRVGESELLHAYTVPFDNRFFFEIIERRNGYQGYGTGDAPVRLAAQAQWQSEQGGTT